MTSLQLIIAILIAILSYSLLILAYHLAAFGRERPKERVQVEESQNRMDRLAPYLELVPIPNALGLKWSGGALSRELIQAGIGWDGRIFASFRWVSLWLAASLGFIFGLLSSWSLLSQFLLLLIMMLAFYGPLTWLRWRVQRRCESIDLNLPDFLDRLTLSMEAGLGFEIALRRIANTFPGLLGEEVRRLVHAIDRGHTRSEALDVFTERTPSNDLNVFVCAVKQSDRLGTSLARTLRIQSNILRTRRRRRAEEAARRLPILIVFPLVFFFLPALLIIYLAPPILHLFLSR